LGIEHIQSIDDPRLSVFRDLPNSKAARDQGKFIAEGVVLVDRLFETGYSVESLLLEKKHLGRYRQFESQTSLLVADGMVDEIIGFDFHRGVLACARRPEPPRLEQMVSQAVTRTTFVVCISVCDQENLGGIIRSAAAFGADCMLIDSTSADPFARRVMRVSMGTNLKLPICQSADLLADLRRLQQDHGVQIVATTLDESATKLNEFMRPDRAAILFGNEGHGLDAEWLDLADNQVTIPMQLDTDSLNVAVSAGIVLYALM